MLVVDDAHWMDGPSARALRFALRRLRVEPVLAVVVSASGDWPLICSPPRIRRATTMLRPAPLERAAVHDLARRIRGWTLTLPTADRVVEQTGGSPLLISSVLHNAADQHQLETWTDVPATAAGAALRMLGSLDDESRRLVEAAAVLAEPADLVTLSGVAEVTAAAPRPMLRLRPGCWPSTATVPCRRPTPCCGKRSMTRCRSVGGRLCTPARRNGPPGIVVWAIGRQRSAARTPAGRRADHCRRPGPVVSPLRPGRDSATARPLRSRPIRPSATPCSVKP